MGRRALCVLSVALAPTLAHATDGLEPRAWVVWSDVECREIVDRDAEPTWHLEYGIPYEDTEITPDEVADSRRMQFFAFCRDNTPNEYLPIWITWADVMAAAEMDLVDPTTIENDRVLETSDLWDGCWFRLNADDARIPITYDDAAAGVDWDTLGVPAGGYTIQGYTWHPAFSLWTERPGFVKVIDGDSDAVGPAVAITMDDFTLYRDETAVLEGCVDAMEGSTLTAYWAVSAADPEWTPIMDETIEGTSFEIAFAVPDDLVGTSALFRIDVTDPMDRTSTA